jgi:oligoribonuclease
MTDTPLLLVDVETSGLDERQHHLLEVGFAVVTANLSEITARASWVIPYRPSVLDDIRTHEADDTVRAMHDASGLWDACRAESATVALAAVGRGIGGTDIGEHITHWVTEHAGDPAIPLCGSSVAFDARWLQAWLPKVVEGRTHRLPDPSGVREILERWGQRGQDIVASRPPARKLHRVDADIDDTLAELWHYRDALGFGPPVPGPKWTASGSVTSGHLGLLRLNTGAALPSWPAAGGALT